VVVSRFHQERPGQLLVILDLMAVARLLGVLFAPIIWVARRARKNN
jgi:hypothetical protein